MEGGSEGVEQGREQESVASPQSSSVHWGKGQHGDLLACSDVCCLSVCMLSPPSPPLPLPPPLTLQRSRRLLPT